MGDPDVKLLLLVVLAAGLAGAFWVFRDDILPAAQESVVVLPEDTAEKAPTQTLPTHPLTPPRPSDAKERNLVSLPALDDSDGYFLLALIDVFGTDVERLLVDEALIDKFVATVDNLPRSHVAEKIRPVGRLSGAFVVDASAGNEALYLEPDNFVRYDFLVTLIAGADLELVTATYRRFYPLLQESYLRLGYPDAYFNDRVVEVIDLLLLTPDPDEPIRLVRPHVLYEFADEELESLSSGQKLLIRMGSDHTAVIKRVLEDLRVLITRAP